MALYTTGIGAIVYVYKICTTGTGAIVYVYKICTTGTGTIVYVYKSAPLIFGTLLCHNKIQIKFEFGFNPLIFAQSYGPWT
jgi:hypothetical protein